MINVLVVDDQPMVARVHAGMVAKVDGFQVAGVVHDGGTALSRVRRGDIDLVLLDLTMPGIDGIQVCRQLHALPEAPDVIVITAVREMTTVRAAVRHGAMLYLVKPFVFTTLRERLLQYASFRQAAQARDAVDQREIDEALAALRAPTPVAVPKSLSPESLDAVRAVLLGSTEGLTSIEVAERTGMARVTARRYLDHLVVSGVCTREPLYGRTGRPVLRYRMRSTLGD
jgi:response regulator of citrate/malate metabolism